MIAAAIEPFAFFSWDSLRAGWYLSWRLFVRVLPAMFVAGLVGFSLMSVARAAGGFVFSIGVLAVLGWSLMLVPRLTSQWAELRYGWPLGDHLQVWWGIAWRGLVASLVAAVIMAVPNVVAVSFQTAYTGSVVGALAGLVIFLLSLANVAVSILATGWAMSRVALAQLGSAGPMAPALTESLSPIEVDPVPAAVVLRAPAPRPAPRAAPAAAAPVLSTEDKQQCPKCGLYETERGSVIGWYCKVCGWREARR